MSGNAWIEYVKLYREKNPHLSYREAMSEAKVSYRKLKVQLGGNGAQGSVDVKRRSAILAYGKKLPQEKICYKVSYFEGDHYRNIDLSKIEIVANNDAEAIVVLLDYLNNHLESAHNQYSGYDANETIDSFVESMFDNDTLWLKRKKTHSKDASVKVIQL